jgi:NADH:ubiquinone oxidoreductase subunit K
VVIKVLFVLLVLCTAALVAVGIALLLRVKRHLKQEQLDAQARSAGEEVDDKPSGDEKST